MPCFRSKKGDRYGTKPELEKYLKEVEKEKHLREEKDRRHKEEEKEKHLREEKDRRHKEEKDRREEKDRTHKEDTDRRAELKRKREALEKEEQELMEEERRKKEEEEKEREKEREKLLMWEREMMEHEDLQGALMLLEEELEAEKERKPMERRPKKVKKEDEKQKTPSPMTQLVQMFKDSWTDLGEAEVTGVKMKVTSYRRARHSTLLEMSFERSWVQRSHSLKKHLWQESGSQLQGGGSGGWWGVREVGGDLGWGVGWRGAWGGVRTLGGGWWGLGLGSWMEGGQEGLLREKLVHILFIFCSYLVFIFCSDFVHILFIYPSSAANNSGAWTGRLRSQSQDLKWRRSQSQGRSI